MFQNMSAGKPRPVRKKHSFYGYFSVLFSLCIVQGGVLWVTYGYLPHQFYMPVSLLSIVAVGLIAFFILNSKIKI